MNEVVDQIAELEDCNYTLFNFVNEISRDIEFFQNQIEAIEGDLAANPPAVKTTDRDLADGIDSKQKQDLAGGTPIDGSADGARKADLRRAIVGVSTLLDLLPSDLKPDQIEVDRNNIVSVLGLIESYVQSAHQVDPVSSCIRHYTVLDIGEQEKDTHLHYPCEVLSLPSVRPLRRRRWSFSGDRRQRETRFRGCSKRDRSQGDAIKV